ARLHSAASLPPPAGYTGAAGGSRKRGAWLTTSTGSAGSGSGTGLTSVLTGEAVTGCTTGCGLLGSGGRGSDFTGGGSGLSTTGGTVSFGGGASCGFTSGSGSGSGGASVGGAGGATLTSCGKPTAWASAGGPLRRGGVRQSSHCPAARCTTPDNSRKSPTRISDVQYR